MSKKAIYFVLALVYSLGLKWLRKTPRRVVLYYHNVYKEQVESFRAQVRFLAEKCRVVQCSRIKKAGGRRQETIVAISFDDAYVDLLETALPILQEYGLPATIFVPTDSMGRKGRWNMPEDVPERDVRVMNRDQIGNLVREGFEILSHTASHPRLTHLEDDEVLDEMKESKRILESVTGREINGISYPYGVYDTRVLRLAQRAGYKYGFTIEPLMVNQKTDDLCISRTCVSPSDGRFTFELKATGCYQINGYVQVLKHKLLSLIKLGNGREKKTEISLGRYEYDM